MDWLLVLLGPQVIYMLVAIVAGFFRWRYFIILAVLTFLAVWLLASWVAEFADAFATAFYYVQLFALIPTSLLAALAIGLINRARTRRGQNLNSMDEV